MTLPLQILAALWAFALPGTLVALQLENNWTLPVRVAVGVALSVLCVPMLCFCAAWLAGMSVTPALVVGVATALNVCAGLSLWWRRRRRRP